ncbi:hypothetical protein QKU58_gp010 [Pyramimonas orientalis virus]|uniref:Uncharacterized protein n=1 Tax=Pyramimonas orientalis virus 01B TaxID=3134525 RepID=A0A7M4CEP6_9VIRU|nr:hypothetical protein QKU58_gp010 [Pyramimonas orientalis virus]QOI90148.1 hypothetical protein HWQ62_00010 [Pyramimonas orientalis virus]
MSLNKRLYSNEHILTNTELSKRRKRIYEISKSKQESRFINKVFIIIICSYLYCWLITLLIIYSFF